MTETTTFRNPVLGGDRPDPAVIKVGDEYWMTYSSFESAPGLLLYRSRDLVNWTYAGSALDEPIGSTFAVDIAEHDGRFFIYIPFIPAPWSTLTAPAIFVIHADSMEGPWSEPIDLGIRRAIDPGHVVGEDGKRYLFVNGIRRIGLTDDGLATVGELEQVYDGWRYPDEWITEAYALEGPKLFWNNGWLYLVSAVGGTAGPATGHMVIAARSGSVHGPWENSPHNPVTRTTDAAERWWSRGHATLVRGTGEGDWWMVSHGYENGYRSLGRQILLEPVTWTDDGWPLGATDIGGELTAPIGAAPQRAAAPFHDDFQTLRLGERWTFHAPSPGEVERLRVDGDGLVLAGKGTSPGDTSPLAVIADQHAYEVEVDVELSDGDAEGGLLLYFNNRLFCGMGMDGERMLSYAGGHVTHWREPAPAVRRLQLRLQNDRHIVTAWYRRPGGEWTRHAIRYETSGYHVNTMGDLQSLRPALYAAAEGSVRFRDFRYRPLNAPEG
ncbi:xylan 1,4-beta-xylosidase [Agromyces flavus]|uniref:Glycosyl hydrolases family 43 n=1 Tax=Agromyces flavus TaxID=589382 RepID=A0A1H1P2E0_9MICO|nr:family 43 glycosylhydrolase [Agromyces flavus]MCP2368004.1 xylan 1,4-beta-xylosidase [Agromyces flavus]GGI47466.1 xylosidase [Agromyces flavus]SDS05190.1 Glycosyl hydrolases family 43 [Agromyces flavus]